MVATAAALVTLLFTLPDSTAFLTDSLDVLCYRSGGPLHDLSSARLYGHPVTGGGYHLLQEHDARGREGKPDSFQVDPGPGAHYYVTGAILVPATDSTLAYVKESCASNIVYVPGYVTGIEGEPIAADPAGEIRTFDIQGRLVREIEASGIYFQKTVHRSGRVTVRKKVHVK